MPRCSALDDGARLTRGARCHRTLYEAGSLKEFERGLETCLQGRFAGGVKPTSMAAAPDVGFWRPVGEGRAWVRPW